MLFVASSERAGLGKLVWVRPLSQEQTRSLINTHVLDAPKAYGLGDG